MLRVTDDRKWVKWNNFEVCIKIGRGSTYRIGVPSGRKDQNPYIETETGVSMKIKKAFIWLQINPPLPLAHQHGSGLTGSDPEIAL